MQSKKNLPSAVVLGMSATGLSVGRSLGRKGVKVYGLDSSKQIGMFSRYIKPVITPNVIENERGFIDYLISFGKELPKPIILLCAHDEYVGAISRHREELVRYFIFSIPSKEIVENFIDKRKSYNVAKDHGLECPATYLAENIEDIKKISEQIKFPCALKPAISHLWRDRISDKKLIHVKSEEELIENFIESGKKYQQIMVQEIIPGSDNSIHVFCAYINSEGKSVAVFSGRKLRQHPIHFGVGCYLISEKNDQLAKLSLEFLSRIKYSGIACLEFKKDLRDSCFKFIELNMRFPMFNELLIASGVDLPNLSYAELSKKESKKTGEFKEGIKLLNMELDISSFWNYRKNKEITFMQYIKSFRGGKIVYTYFSPDDIVPFIIIYIKFIKSVLKKILTLGYRVNVAHN